MQRRKRVVIVVVSAVNGPRVRAVARWLRALVPAAALVMSVPDLDGYRGPQDEDAIIVDADELPSGPLSLAAALTRATNAPRT